MQQNVGEKNNVSPLICEFRVFIWRFIKLEQSALFARQRVRQTYRSTRTGQERYTLIKQATHSQPAVYRRTLEKRCGVSIAQRI